MTAYAPYQSDPTNIVGKRIGAWVIDLVIYFILAAVVATAFGGSEVENVTVGSDFMAEAYCDQWRDENSGFCFDNNGDVTTVEVNAAGGLFWLAHLVGYGVLSGVLGGSLGKLAVGLRVVTADGQQAGIGKNLLRTVLWIGDAITCGLPIIGGVLLVSTKGHRRLGDMAASTFVIEKDRMGQPVQIPGLNAGYGPPPTGPGGWPTPGQPGPQGPAGWSQASGSSAWPGVTPPTTGQSGSWAPTGDSQPPSPGAPSAEGPTWDAARNAYIQYDRDRGEWLQWSDEAREWKPISR